MLRRWLSLASSRFALWLTPCGRVQTRSHLSRRVPGGERKAAPVTPARRQACARSGRSMAFCHHTARAGPVRPLGACSGQGPGHGALAAHVGFRFDLLVWGELEGLPSTRLGRSRPCGGKEAAAWRVLSSQTQSEMAEAP